MYRTTIFRAALLAVAFAFASTTASANLNLWVSYHYQGMTNYRTGDYRDAEKLLLSAMEDSEQNFRRGETLDALGMVYTALGEFDKAQDYYQQALHTKEKSLGKRHRQVPVTLNNMGDLDYILGKTEEAKDLYKRALEINKRDQFNIEVCRSLNGLALIHNDAGEFPQAEELLKRAVHDHDRGDRRYHPHMATVLVNLGILYTNQGRYDEAEPMFARAKYLQDQTLRVDHPDVAVRLHATAALYQATGRTAEAGELARSAEEIRSKQAAKGDLY